MYCQKEEFNIQKFNIKSKSVLRLTSLGGKASIPEFSLEFTASSFIDKNCDIHPITEIQDRHKFKKDFN